jgi:hypothetical protein
LKMEHGLSQAAAHTISMICGITLLVVMFTECRELRQLAVRFGSCAVFPVLLGKLKTPSGCTGRGLCFNLN